MNDKLLSTLTILYVEDEQDARDTLARYLKRRVANVITAENGEIGLQLFNEHRPHIVITDINMPIMDGLTMSQAIRNIDATTPIIITSAHTESNLLLTSINLGITQYIVKPINLTQLIETITNIATHLSQKKMQDVAIKNLRQQLTSTQNAHAKIEKYLHNHMQAHLVEHNSYLRYLSLSNNSINSSFFYAATYKNTHYLLLADTANSGLSAVIPSLQAPRVFMDQAHLGLSLSSIATAINAELFDLNFPDHFINATLIRADPQEKYIEILNCGNPPTLLVDELGTILKEFPSQSLALGSTANGRFASCVERHTYTQPVFAYAFTQGLISTLFSNSATTQAQQEDYILLRNLFTETHPQHAFNTAIAMIEATQSKYRADDVALVEMKLETHPQMEQRVYH